MDIKYPLEEVLNIKKRRFDKAVLVLDEKKAVLKQAKNKLKELEDARDKVLKHKNDKLSQLRESLDKGESTLKIQNMKRYLDTVGEKLIKHQSQVTAQIKQVEAAEKQVEAAKEDLIQKQKDLEKIKIHKTEWLKEQEIEEKRQATIRHDELGANIHELKKREKPHNKS